MAKNTSIKYSLLILLSLLTLIKSQDEWISYIKGEGFTKEERNVTEAKRYGIEFVDQSGRAYDGPLYMKIEVTALEGKLAPLLCFSHDDPYCESRDILVRNPTGNSVYLWVRKEQFQEVGTEPYIVITCPGNEDKCSYTIKGSDSEMSYMTLEPNTIFSYKVTNKNKHMDVLITNQTAYNNDDILAICLDGSRRASIRMSTYHYAFEVGPIRCVYLPASQQELDWGKFNILGAEDDYLTLSINKFTLTGPQVNLGRADDGYALPNGLVVSSYITGTTLEECFPLSKEVLSEASNELYIVGKIHTKYANFFLRNENGDLIQGTYVEIMDGQLSFVLTNPKAFRWICFERPTEENYVQSSLMFSFQIIDYGKLSSLGKYTYNEPMNTGTFYRRILPKGGVTYYYGAAADILAKKYDYTLANIKGSAKLYITKCNNFPDCTFTKDDLVNMNETHVSKANDHQIWTSDYYSSSALGIDKDVMVVYCEDNELNSDYCEFDTSIFYKGQDIELIENKKLFKYVLKDEKGKLVVNLHENRIVTRVTIDIMVFTGDVIFTAQEQEGVTIKQNYLSNKVLFEAILSRGVLEEVIIEFEADLNSFFNVKYTVDSQSVDQIFEYMSSAESYLVQINPLLLTKTKTVSITNIYGDKTPFITNFFALNCEFQVKRGDIDIPFSDGYAQDNIEAGKLINGYYTYNIKISETDQANYINKMCMLYVAGYEVNNDVETENIREIVVAENINQQIIFEENFSKIRFTYPIVNIYRDLTYHVNVIDRARYKINGYLNGQLIIKDLRVSVTQTFYIFGNEYTSYCSRGELCSFSLDVELEEKIVPTNPMIEITFREILSVPSYLQKGNAKLDYVCGDRFYYLYTDIGKNDEGEISLNFLREFGSLWAKIVKKDLKNAEPEANWRKYYRMPGPEWEDSLPFNDYTKKLTISSQDTNDCINGCYLLMTVQINDIGDYVPDYIFYSFSILVKTTPINKTYTEIPKVVIQVNEFIVGSLDITKMDEGNISEFYEVWLPHDSDSVEFDWQNSLAGLYINLDRKRPTISNAHFVLYPPGRPSVLSLSKDEILQKAKEIKVIDEDVNSLQDLSLVIGVWTNKTDAVNYELYSLRVQQNFYNETEDLGIIEINADQKVICKPKAYREGYTYSYRCLFMISYNSDATIFSPIYVYGFSSNPAAITNLLGSFIDRDVYNSYDIVEIKKSIPSIQNAEYNTYEEGVNYIYVKELPMKKYFLVNIYSDYPDDLILINSVPIFNLIAEGTITQVYPNSHTEQLFSIQKGHLQMIFPGEEGVAATVEVISGEAEINWVNEDAHKVKGAEDRITLFSDKNNKQLVIRNTKLFNSNLKATIDDPGFLFYVTYQARKDGFNFDEIKFQKSTEISYLNTDLPTILYCKLGLVNNDLNIAIQFKDNSAQSEGSFVHSPIIIRSAIMKEDTIYNARKNSQTDMVPSKEKSVFGYYDPVIKTALIYLSKAKIDSYNIDQKENPTLYLRLEKSSYYEEITFNKFDIEARVAGINDHVVPVEEIYHYGKLGANQENVFYKLKLNKNKIFMRVQVAFNGEDLEFTLHQVINYKESNQTFPDWRASKEKGKIIITFMQPDIDYIYLNIFKKKYGAVLNEQLTNYAFKYITAESEGDFYDYKSMSNILNCEVKHGVVSENSDTVQCIFNQIHSDLGEMNVTYFLKVVENSNYIYGEQMNTIAITESPNTVFYKRNPIAGVGDDDDKILMKGDGYFSNLGYINIIAQVQQNNIIEYVAYDAIMDLKPDPSENEEENKEEKGEFEDEEENKSEKKEDEKSESENEEEKYNGESEEKSPYNPDVKNPDNSSDTLKIVLGVTIPAAIIIIVLVVFFILRWKRKKSSFSKSQIENLVSQSELV